MAEPTIPDRFSEESATYALRGGDTPDLDAGVAAIRNVLRTLPARPGVYRMLSAGGDVLYVGKAKSLKNRVLNYTQVTRLPRRIMPQRKPALPKSTQACFLPASWNSWKRYSARNAARDRYSLSVTG